MPNKKTYILFKDEDEVCRGSLSDTTKHEEENLKPKDKRTTMLLFLPHINYRKIMPIRIEVLKSRLSLTRRRRMNKELNDMEINKHA